MPTADHSHREQPLSLAHTARFSLGILPGIHALHDNLILLALHHVVGEHGVEVGDGSCQHDPVSAEFMVPNLRQATGRDKGSVPGIPCSIQAFKSGLFSDCFSQSFLSLISMPIWLIPVHAHFCSLKQKFPIGALFYGSKQLVQQGPSLQVIQSPFLLLCKILTSCHLQR